MNFLQLQRWPVPHRSFPQGNLCNVCLVFLRIFKLTLIFSGTGHYKWPDLVVLSEEGSPIWLKRASGAAAWVLEERLNYAEKASSAPVWSVQVKTSRAFLNANRQLDVSQYFCPKKTADTARDSCKRAYFLRSDTFLNVNPDIPS